MPRNSSIRNTDYIQVFDVNDDIVCVQWSSVLNAMSASNVMLFGIPFTQLPQRLQQLIAAETELNKIKEKEKKQKGAKVAKAIKEGDKGKA